METLAPDKAGGGGGGQGWAVGGRGADVCGVIGGRLWGARKVFGRGGFTYWGNWGLRRGVHSPVGLMWLAEVSGGVRSGGHIYMGCGAGVEGVCGVRDGAMGWARCMSGLWDGSIGLCIRR